MAGLKALRGTADVGDPGGVKAASSEGGAPAEWQEAVPAQKWARLLWVPRPLHLP